MKTKQVYQCNKDTEKNYDERMPCDERCGYQMSDKKCGRLITIEMESKDA